MKSLFKNWRYYLISEDKNLDTDQVSKVVILNEREKILLLKSALGNFKGEWDLPGGHIHKDESSIQGLKREVKEETDLDIKNPLKLYKEGKITFYKVNLPKGNIILSHEHSEYKFFTFEETQKENFETSQKFIKAIKEAYTS